MRIGPPRAAARLRERLHRIVRGRVERYVERIVAGSRVELYLWHPELRVLNPVRPRSRFLRSLERNRVSAADGWMRALAARHLELGVVLDVGAKYGSTATWFAERAQQVHAFEPDPANRARLREVLRVRSIRNVEVVEEAVSDQVGRATLHRKAAAGHHSLADVGASPTVGTLVVPTTTVDAHCRRHGIGSISLLKIDVEGFEPEVLRGASGLLREQAISMVLFEYTPRFYAQRGLSPRAPLDVLQEHGYELFGTDLAPAAPERLAAVWQTDLIALPTGKGPDR
jgi:FkbM family methyltransferase